MQHFSIQALELDDGEDRRWQERANCLGVDPDLFFPERGASTKEAKAVCNNCEVRLDCLEYALRHGEKFGIWGGMSGRGRPARRPRGAGSVASALSRAAAWLADASRRRRPQSARGFAALTTARLRRS